MRLLCHYTPRNDEEKAKNKDKIPDQARNDTGQKNAFAQ